MIIYFVVLWFIHIGASSHFSLTKSIVFDQQCTIHYILYQNLFYLVGLWVFIFLKQCFIDYFNQSLLIALIMAK